MIRRSLLSFVLILPLERALHVPTPIQDHQRASWKMIPTV